MAVLRIPWRVHLHLVPPDLLLVVRVRLLAAAEPRLVATAAQARVLVKAVIPRPAVFLDR